MAYEIRPISSSEWLPDRCLRLNGPFDPRGAAFEGPNPERGGGAGLAMIVSLCRIAGYARRAGRNRLILELPL